MHDKVRCLPVLFVYPAPSLLRITRFSPDISSEVLMSDIGCIGRGPTFCMGLDCWVSIKILHLQFLQAQTHFKNSVSDLPSNL